MTAEELFNIIIPRWAARSKFGAKYINKLAEESREEILEILQPLAAHINKKKAAAAARTRVEAPPQPRETEAEVDEVAANEADYDVMERRLRYLTDLAENEDFIWDPTTEARYEQMKGAVPPFKYGAGGNAFLAGESMGQNANGHATFEAYRRIGTEYFRGSRPITQDEFDRFTEVTESLSKLASGPVGERYRNIARACAGPAAARRVKESLPAMAEDRWRQTARGLDDFSWESTTQEQYESMRECVSPHDEVLGAFLMGEPVDTDENGFYRFMVFRQTHGTYWKGSRPITDGELYHLMGVQRRIGRQRETSESLPRATERCPSTRSA